MEKKNIYFIIGHGHSGSSIIGRLLSSKKNTVNVGELGIIKRYIKRKEQCSCGKEILQCSFWEESLKNIIIDKLKINTKDFLPMVRMKEKVNENVKVFNNIFVNNTQIDTIVDSSKNPMRALGIIFFARSEFNFEVFETQRNLADIKKSYKKRTKNVNAGRIAKNYKLFHLNYFYYKILSLFVTLMFKMMGVKKQTIHSKDYDVFIRENSWLNVEEVSNSEFYINEFLNHSIGGSHTSRKTNIRVK